MALSQGNKALWSDVTNIYQRTKSENTRWGRNNTTTNAAVGDKILTAHGKGLRDSLIDLTTNISFLTNFKTTMTGTAAINQGDLIAVPTLNTMKTVLNAIRTICGYRTGSACNTFGTGHNSNATGCTNVRNDYNWGWSFFSGGDFGHRSSRSFTFVTGKTVNNFCANCSSGFYSCNPFCTAGFCTSYFNVAI